MTADIDARFESIRRKIASHNEMEPEPPMSEDGLQAFESENGISLPDEYRLFLGTVCNGVYGDLFGLFSLGELPDEDWPKGDLSKPFPFTQKRDYEAEGYPDPEEEDDSTLNGYLYVSSAGGGQFWILIITGPERGNMWIECDGYFPSVPRVGFLDWCEQWAERGWDDGLIDLVLGGGQSPP